MENRLKYNRLKTVLSDKGKSREDLAKFLDTHISTVAKWNTNVNQPPIPVLYRIAEYLEVSVYDLLEPTPRALPAKRRPKND